MAKKDKKNSSYSHTLLTQESILLWITTLSFVVLAFYCIHTGYTGTLPWLSSLVAFPWSAYGISQVYYYKKSMKENTEGGIKFETVLEEVRQAYGKSTTQIDWSINESYSNSSNPTGIGIGQSTDIDLDYGL